MKGLEPRPAWARLDVSWRFWLMMLYRLPHVALSMRAPWRLWIVLCAVICVTLAGCRIGKPAANCTTGAAAATAPEVACGRGPWCLFGRTEVETGPVLSPFLPVPTYNVYNYAATPMTVVPLSPVSGPAAGGQMPDTVPPDVLPPTAGEAVPLNPAPGQLPAPLRDVPGEPLPQNDDAPRFEGRATAATVEESAVPAATHPGGSILRLRAETLESRPSANEQIR